MAPDVLERLLPFLEYVEMPRQLNLAEPGMVNDHIYFPETGIGSIVVSPATGQKTEIGLFGREGLAPTSGVSGTSSTPYHVFMQVAGTGYRIANIHLQVAMARLNRATVMHDATAKVPGPQCSLSEPRQPSKN